MHSNPQPSALSKYTVYDSDGSPLEVPSAGHDGESSKYHGPLAKFFDPAVIKMIFSDQEIRTRLGQFLEHFITGAEREQCLADMKFLDKCDEQIRAVDALSASISEIAANHTSPAAPYPLELPFGLASKVNRDTSHYAKMTAPFLKNLFLDARACAEDRLARHLYPEYVKFQLTQCARTSLSVRRSLPTDFRSAYPGLGSAFCLAAPHHPDNPILFASDSFTHLHGRSPITLSFLHSLPAGSAAALRLREALALGRPAVELVVTSRADPLPPFWNLFLVCPLSDDAGAIRFHLGAQINVSDSMGPHAKDILRVLGFRPPAAEPARRDGPRRRTFAELFARKPAPTPLVISAPLPAPAPATAPSAEDVTTSSAQRSTHTAHSTTVLERPFDQSSTPYANLVVLRYAGGVGAAMPVAFCSVPALELLGAERDKDVLGRDVFEVLKGVGVLVPGGDLRDTVLKRIAAGEAVVVDLVPGEGQRIGGKGRKRKGGAGVNNGATRSGSADCGVVFGSGVGKLVTHWTPLKDGEGRVEWVVLVLTPAVR